MAAVGRRQDRGGFMGPARRAGVARSSFVAVAVLALSGLGCCSAAQAADPQAFVQRSMPAPVRAEAGALQRTLGTQGVVDIDASTGTPRVLARLDGTLTGRSARAPEAIAAAYVSANLAALGLTQADFDALDGPELRSLPGAITQVRWRQVVDGIVSADSDLRVNVAADGRVLNVLGSPAHALDLASATPGLDAGEAVRAVQDDVGDHRSVVRASGPSGTAQATRYSDGTAASLVVFDGRLAWRVRYQTAPDAVYDATVDAASGAVLQRANMVKSDAPAQVWERYPGSPVGGTAQPVDLESNGWLPAAAATLNGNNAHAFSDVNDNDVADAGEEVTRTAGTFNYPFTSFTGTGCDAAHQCSWSGGTSWNTNRAQNATQAFYFANRFHDHLASAPIGFGVAQGSFEGGDRLQLNSDDGAATGPDSVHINNANMFTPPDGQSPTMQMYLFRTSSFRDVNGGDDAAVLYHEYTHGLSNRLVTDAGGFGALNSFQAGAMGEAWSDWYAQDFIVAQFPTLDTAASGELPLGAYEEFTGGTAALRSQPIDCPAVGADPLKCPGRPSLGSGGYTYGDFGHIVNGPEVHSDGEIWAETLWDLRTALGSAKAASLITSGMALLPPEPSFLDGRNGIILADQALFAGADVNALWTLFANRGMGFFAASTGGEDSSPWQDFATPPAAGTPTGTISGIVTDDVTGAPVSGAKVGLAGLSGLGAYSATTGADGRYTIAAVPQGTYVKAVAGGAGYDQAVTSLSVGGGVTLTYSPALKRDWASTLAGATLTQSNGTEFNGIGCGPSYAIDQTQATGWSTVTGSEKFLVVRLPSTIDVTQFAIDPAETCGDGAGSATAGYRIETSPDGTVWTVAQSGTLGPAARHVLNFLTPTAGTSGVRYARVTITSAASGTSVPFVDLTEFGVYGAPSGDHTAPDTTITSGPVGTINVASASFSFSSTEAGSTFECKLDGPGAATGTFASCTSPRAIVGLADGSYTFSVRAFDVAGNPDGTPATRSFTVDTTAPDTTITAGPVGTINVGAASFSFSATEAGSTFECKLDGPGAATGSFAACTSPQSFVALADGAYTFSVRAIDPAGNPDGTPATRTFTVDTAAPDTTIDAGPPAVANQRSVSLGFSASKPGSTFECRLTGPGQTGTFAACTSPASYANLADGSYVFDVRASDPASHADPTPASRAFTVDTAAPDTTIAAAPSALSHEAAPQVTFTATEAGSTFECKLDGPGAATGAFTSCASPRTLGPLADGTYTFSVRATDLAGNTDATPASSSFTVDTAAPDTTITAGPTGTTNVNSPSFSFTATEAGSTFECRLDGPGAATGAYAACASPRAFASLADGTYTFSVRATDAAGNTDGTPATRIFTVDATAPHTTITSGPSGPTNGNRPAFAFSSSKPASTFECKLDGPGAATGTFASCTTPADLGPLGDGAYTLSVRATDPVGNVDPVPATRSFTVDTAAPDTFIDSGPASPVHAGALTFAVRSSEAGTVACALDGAAFGSCTAALRAEDLALGDHVFRAQATDLAGNADASPAEWRFTVANAAPTATLTLDSDTGPAPLTVHATIGGTDPDGDALTYAIDYGDGQTASGPLPAGPLEHRYDASGSYTVKLDVHDARATGTATHVVAVTTPQAGAPVALTLGPPTSLGALVVGVDRDYTATVTATSTAPDRSILTVVDPSTTAPGHLLNGTYALARPLMAQATSAAGSGDVFAALDATPLKLLTYPAAVTNDVSTITFRQTVAATDTLRSGIYAKTLTFTLALDRP